MNLEEICTLTCTLVKETGHFIAQEAAHFNAGVVEIKSFNQLVSYVDKTAEEKLVNGLQIILPNSGFITEENTIASVQQEWMWVIDPLDGTTNFVHGVPVYSISIGLLQNGQPVLGVVYEINRDEMFYAYSGSGAFLNGKPIHVTSTTNLEDTLLATGFPYYDFEIMQQYLNALQVFLKETRGMRRMGSAAVDLAYVACGRFDGFFEYGLNAWDVTGGALIVKEAGGLVTDFSRSDNYLFGKEIIAGSPGIFDAFADVITIHFKK